MNKYFLAIIFFIIFMSNNTAAQNALSNESYRVYEATGKSSDLNSMINSLESTDVVFLGEQHDDPTAHVIELEILRMAFEKYGRTRQIVLSLEMFERDVQLVVDEYLQDLINENNFVTASRAWNNYKTDYRPLVEFAKANKLPVVAANAPRRYVNRVGRLGADSLVVLSPVAKQWLAPLPIAVASDEYSKKFRNLMGGMGNANDHGQAKMLEAQSLWDATMADSIASQLKKQTKPLVIHVNGGFHSENRLGSPEHLMRYAPKTRISVVTMISEGSFPNFDQKFRDKGNFVILTDPRLPRSK